MDDQSFVSGVEACSLPAGQFNHASHLRLARVYLAPPDAMARWHALFEQQAPAAQEAFLRSLGLGPGEIARIRSWSRQFGV